MDTMDVWLNVPILASLIAIAFAQVVKVPLQFIGTRKLDWQLVTSTGGMPSSHSAAVTSLATAVGLQDGWTSTTFSVAVVFAIIVMFDATGVRRQAGEQAIVLNQLMNDFHRIVNEAKDWQKKEGAQKQQELKELLGHKPIEVFFGALTGIAIGILVHFWLLG